MSVTKAFGDSNASPHDPNQEANTGPDESGYLGYVQMPFPSQMPARKNSDITGTKDFSFTMINQGTSAPSYGEQSEEASSSTGGGDTQGIAGEGEGEDKTGHGESDD